MKLVWKVKGCLKQKPRSGSGSYHAAHAARHLENHCNEAGRSSMQQRLIERNNKRTKHEDGDATKTEQFKEEAVSAKSKRERGGGTQQKIPSKLSY